MVGSPMPRSKEFDPDQVLDRAVEVFWRKGYAATSLRELLDAMQISRQSLYDTYGDKRGLFLKALTRYRNWLEAAYGDTAARPGADLRDLRAVFHLSLDRATNSGMRSCMLANASIELGLDDSDTQDIVRGHYAFVEDCFVRVLANVRDAGQLRVDADLRSLARHLCNCLHGIGVLGRAGYDHDQCAVALDTALATVGHIHS